MSKIIKSAKEIQISKTNTTIVLAVSAASIVIAFSLVSCKALLSQQRYQSRVISEQQKALKIAKADLVAAGNLSSSYAAFNASGSNIISGLSTGTGPQDGTNSKIVLDALPSQYDYPALVTSLDALLTQRGFKGSGLSGSEDPAQATTVPSASPVPIEIPLNISVTGSYKAINDLTDTFSRTIRPISIKTMQVSGTDSALSLNLTGNTYYQPAKNLTVTSKVVK